MLGRPHRARRTLQQRLGRRIVAAGVLRTYDPALATTALAIGLGVAGGLGGGGAATGRAVGALLNYGERERRRFADLPHRLLVVVTEEDIRAFDWSRGIDEHNPGRTSVFRRSALRLAASISATGSPGVPPRRKVRSGSGLLSRRGPPAAP